MDEGWIDIEEAVNYIGVNKDTIRNWIKKTQKSQLIGLVNCGSLKGRN